MSFFGKLQSFKILQSPASSAPYLCHDGQGEEGKSFKALNVCDKTQCENECTKDVACKGFDFTTIKCEWNTCRLYPTNIPRTDGGSEKRKYCRRTEGKR